MTCMSLASVARSSVRTSWLFTGRRSGERMRIMSGMSSDVTVVAVNEGESDMGSDRWNVSAISWCAERARKA